MAASNEQKTLNKKYEVFEVTPQYETISDLYGNSRRRLSGFERGKKLRETSTSPDKAAELNSQSEEMRQRLYEITPE